MQLSAKTQYACLAALELARRFDDPRPIGLRLIADEQRISHQFLVQILLQLKRAGLVNSTRGAGGGYRLAHPPEDISLLQIIEAIEGVSETAEPTNDSPVARVFCQTWNEVSQSHRQRLADASLAAMCQAIDSPTADMYYI